MRCERQKEVLEYLQGDVDNDTIEEHINQCPECQSLMDGFLAGEQMVRLPEENSEQVNLKEQVEHFDKGRTRIIIFSIVGLILGWWSRVYINVEFLPLKVILAVPYKVNEMIYRLLFEMPWYSPEISQWRHCRFPYSNVADFLAEMVGPAVIGCFLYGSLAYFSGDKRVFTLKRFMVFLLIWLGIIVLFWVTVFGINGAVINIR